MIKKIFKFFKNFKAKEYKFKAVPCSKYSIFYKIYFKRPGDFLWKICYKDKIEKPLTGLPVIKKEKAFELMQEWLKETGEFEKFLHSQNVGKSATIYCCESSVNMDKALS